MEMKCDGKCFECKFTDCILTDEEALISEKKNPTYDTRKRNSRKTHEKGVNSNENNEKVKLYQHEYYLRNRAKYKDYFKQYYLDHKEEMKDRSKTNYELQDKAILNEKKKKYYRQNADTIKLKTKLRNKEKTLFDKQYHKIVNAIRLGADTKKLYLIIHETEQKQAEIWKELEVNEQQSSKRNVQDA